MTNTHPISEPENPSKPNRKRLKEKERLQRRIYMARKRANETEEERELRRIRNRQCAALRRARETEEEAEQRRIKNRQYAAMKRARQSQEEAERRQMSNVGDNLQNGNNTTFATTSSFPFLNWNIQIDPTKPVNYSASISDDQLVKIAEQIVERTRQNLRNRRP